MNPQIQNETFPLTKIVSGGQTGVDRAALDTALFLEIEHGGWCPRGRRAEDGRIDSVYRLVETDEADYSIRTEKNVLDSDGTLIFCQGPISGGTKLTVKQARRHRKPHLIIDLAADDAESQQRDPLVHWIREQNIQVLNVAGPRESTAIGIGQKVERFLVNALRPFLSPTQ